MSDRLACFTHPGETSRDWRQSHETGDLPDMRSKLHEPREPTNRSATPPSDWATAATEARRQRDAAAKVMRSEQQRQWRQAHAWSPKEFSQTRNV